MRHGRPRILCWARFTFLEKTPYRPNWRFVPRPPFLCSPITLSRAILNCATNVFYITDPCASSPLYSTYGDPSYVLYDAMRDGADVNPNAALGVYKNRFFETPCNTCIGSNFVTRFTFYLWIYGAPWHARFFSSEY